MIISERTLLRDEARMSEFIRALGDGAVVIYPSETIYALGGALSSVKATEKIFSLKARDESRAIFSIVYDLRQAESFCDFKYDLEYRLFGEYGHRGLTILLQSRPFVSSRARGGADTLGVRLASTELCRVITERIAEPLTSSSATLTNELISDIKRGDVLPDKIENIPQYLLDECEFVIDGGELPAHAPSTVIRVVGEDRIVLIREGVVLARDLEALNIRIERPAERAYPS
jgi:L-threonylcarbamoyladenylate synthase